MNGLKDKIAVVTGGSRGLGRNTGLRVAGNGADVIRIYRQKKDEAAAVAAEIEANGRKANILPLDVGNVRTFGDFAAALSQALGQNGGAGNSTS